MQFNFHGLLPKKSPNKDYKIVSSLNDFQNLKYIILKKLNK